MKRLINDNLLRNNKLLRRGNRQGEELASKARQRCNSHLEPLEGRQMLSTYFIAPTGADTAAGSQAAPFATLDKALKTAKSGDTIILRGGTYSGNQTVDGQNLTIEGMTGETAKIVSPINNANIYFGLDFGPEAKNITVKNLDISGGYYYAVKTETTRTNATGANFYGASYITFDNVKFHDSGTHVIKLSPDTDHLTFTDCEIYKSGDRDPTQGQGVDAVNVDDLLFENNYIHDTTQNAIFVKGGSQRAMIVGNLIKNAGYGGILLGQDTDADVFDTIQNPNRYEALNCIAENNVIDGTKYGGIQAWSSHNCQFINNWVANAGQSGQGAIFISINSFNKQNDNLTFSGNTIGAAPGKQLINVADGAMGAGLFMSNNEYYGNNSTIDNNPNFSGTIAQWQAHSKTDTGSKFVATGNPPFTGDLNHDGLVNIDDYTTIDTQYPLGTKGVWWMADANMDGQINADDYIVIDVATADAAAAAQSAAVSGGVASSAAPAATMQTQALPQDVTLTTTTPAALAGNVQANAAVSPMFGDVSNQRLIDQLDASSSNSDLTLATL